MVVSEYSLKEAQTRAYESSLRGNEVSTEYVKTMNTINSRVVLMALGSASLLITFLGILFNVNRDVSHLDYTFVVISVVCFIVCSALLLFYNWLVVMFRFGGAASFHRKDRVAVIDQETTIAKENGLFDKTREPLAKNEVAAYLKELSTSKAKLEKQIVHDEKWTKMYYVLSVSFLPVAYCFIIAGYLFSLLFFLGVIELLSAS